MSGQRGLTLKVVDKLADVLEWKLESKGRRRPPGFMDAPRAKVKAKRGDNGAGQKPIVARPRQKRKAIAAERSIAPDPDKPWRDEMSAFR